MPLGRITIEQTLDAWIAEVEAGGIAARCRVLRAADFDTILERARAAYRELTDLSVAGSALVAPGVAADKRPARRGRAA